MRCPSHKEARKTLVSELKKSYKTQAQPNLPKVLSSDDRSFKALASFLETVTRFNPP